MPSYYIACDSVPVFDEDQSSILCSSVDGNPFVYTQQEVIEIFAPTMTTNDAHIIGIKLLGTWLIVWTGKKIYQMLRYS